MNIAVDIDVSTQRSDSEWLLETMEVSQRNWRQKADSIPLAKDCSLTVAEVIRECVRDGESYAYDELREIITTNPKLFHSLPNRVDLESLLDWEQKILLKGIGNPNEVKKCIQCFKAVVVAARSGLDLVIWANTLDSKEFRDEYREDFLSLASHHGIKGQLLKTAAVASRDLMGKPASTRSVLQGFEIAKSLNDVDLTGGYIGDLKSFVKSKGLTNPQNLGRYGLEGIVIRSSSHAHGNSHKFGHIPWSVGVGDLCKPIYLDGPIAIVLTYDSEPLAVIAGLVDRENRLMITQFQGISSVALLQESESRLITKTVNVPLWELEPIEWKKYLLSVFVKIGGAFGIREVGIQSAANNRWTKPDEKGEIHLPMERAEKIYDNFADQLGMDKQTGGNFSMVI